MAGFLSWLLSIGGAFVLIPAFLAIFHGYFHFDDKFLLQLTLGTAMACIVVNSSCTTLAHNRQSSVSWSVLAAHWPMICTGTAIGVVCTGYLDAALIHGHCVVPRDISGRPPGSRTLHGLPAPHA